MQRQELIVLIVKLASGGLAAFLAVVLWGRTRDAAWTGIAAGLVFLYAGVVYDSLRALGVSWGEGVAVAGIPVVPLVFATVPYVLFCIAVILLLRRTL